MIDDTAKLRKLARKATAPPWHVREDKSLAPDHRRGHVSEFVVCDVNDSWVADCGAAPDDAAFIAAVSPTTVIALLDEIDSLRHMLSGRTISCAACGESASRLAAMVAARDELADRLEATLPKREHRGALSIDEAARIDALRKVGGP